MKCLACGEEFTAQRLSAKFCSAKCRVKHNRDDIEIPVKDLGPEDLYRAIRRYSGDTWKDSEEFKELMSRLKSKPIEELEEEGYFVPLWKL